MKPAAGTKRETEGEKPKRWKKKKKKKDEISKTITAAKLCLYYIYHVRMSCVVAAILIWLLSASGVPMPDPPGPPFFPKQQSGCKAQKTRNRVEEQRGPGKISKRQTSTSLSPTYAV